MNSCANCKKPHEESPRREFSPPNAGLLGVCIACEKAHDARVERERNEQGIFKFEVIYYTKVLCCKTVYAKSKKEAEDYLYGVEKAKGGLHQFTVKDSKRVTAKQ